MWISGGQSGGEDPDRFVNLPDTEEAGEAALGDGEHAPAEKAADHHFPPSSPITQPRDYPY